MIGRLRLSLSSEQDARARILLLLKKNSDRVQRAYYLDRDLDKALLKKKMERKIVTGCSGPIIWIGILIKRCVGWRWRKERI